MPVTPTLKESNPLGYLRGLNQSQINEAHATTFVDPQRKILYVENPKCACTSSKFLLLNLQGVYSVPFVIGAQVGASMSLQIHHRPSHPLSSVITHTQANPSWFNHVDDWLSFSFVRHPVERLFSAWRDKIFLVEPGFERYYQALGKNQKFIEFQDFVEFVLTQEDLVTCDRHWRLQTQILELSHHLPFRFYKLSEINQFENDLGIHLKKSSQYSGASPKLPALNESFHLSFRNFIDSKTAKRIEATYEADMTCFGFEPLQAMPDKPSQQAADIVNGWTNAIFERNRTISMHVLGAQRIFAKDQQATNAESATQSKAEGVTS